MAIKTPLKSQYHAALKALRLAIEECPDAMWNAPADGLAAFWRVAYHALFYTHFYAQKDEHSFTPWPRHQPGVNFLGNLPWDGNRPPKPAAPCTRDEVLEYWRFCDAQIDAWVDALDLSAAECGFPWYPMPKLEHQLVNLRHVQHHAAALATRLRREAGVEIEWVGRA